MRDRDTRRSPTKARLGGLVLAAGLAVAGPTPAAELRIALQGEITTLDPQFEATHYNEQIARHLFGPLVLQDARQRPQPGLAQSWRLLGDTVWEFNLRPGVRFHDGTPFTAEDVVFSFWRVANVPNSPSPFTPYTGAIKEVTALDPLTVRIETKGPAPSLLVDISAVAMVSKRLSEGRTTADFNRGVAAIGTGPYRLVEWVPGARVVLAANPDYWGPKEPWDKVTFRPIASGASRVAAVLAGDVDLIDQVPPNDLEGLRADPRIAVVQVPSARVLYLQMDSARDKSPAVTDERGAPLDRNPLKDVRVRRAIDRAINRAALTERLLSGQAVPANQLLPRAYFGASDRLAPVPFDPAGARRLLAEAGYPNGFGLTLAATNNRYPRDSEIAQAIAQMLTQVGIATKVEAMPSSLFFNRGSRLEFSFLMAGFLGSGEPSAPLRQLAATYDAARGWGASNRGRYSNPALDDLFARAAVTLDDERRSALLAQGYEMVAEDVGVISLLHFLNGWAMRRGLTYEGTTTDHTLAMGVRARP